MSKISGISNIQRLLHLKPQPPAIVGKDAEKVDVGFVPERLNAAMRNPIYADIGQFTTLGQRNIQHLMDKLEENTTGVPLTIQAGMEILYPGKSAEDREKLLKHLNGSEQCSVGMQETILKPILEKLTSMTAGLDLGRDKHYANNKLWNAKKAVNEFLETIGGLDRCDIASQQLTIKNHVLRIACSAYDGSKMREATGGTIISEGEYQAFVDSLPQQFRDSDPSVQDMLFVREDGGYELRSPKSVILYLMTKGNNLSEDLQDAANKSLMGPEDRSAQFKLLDKLFVLVDEFLDEGKKVRYTQIIDELLYDLVDNKNLAWNVDNEKRLKAEALCMDKEISDLIVEKCFNVLNSKYDLESKELQKESLDFRNTCARQSLALLEMFTQNIPGEAQGSRTLLEILDLGEIARVDGVQPLWSFTFDNEDSETQFSPVEQLKREASFLSGMLISGMGNIFADAEALTEAKVAYTGTMISQLLLSSPLMRESVVKVMGEELGPNPASHLGTLSREMPTVRAKEDVRVMNDMLAKLGPGSGDTRISGGVKTQLKKIGDFILKRPTHWLIGLPLAAGVLTLALGGLIVGFATVPGWIIAGTLILSSGFLLMILGAPVVFQPPYVAFICGLVFGTRRDVAKVFTSDRLTQLWKVTQGDRGATLAYYKSKGLADSSGVTLNRKRWGKDSIGGDLALLRAQAGQEYVAEMGNAGLLALIKSAEERLVKLGKLSTGYVGTGSKEDKRRAAVEAADNELRAIDLSTNKAGKAIAKNVKEQDKYNFIGEQRNYEALDLDGGLVDSRTSQHLAAFPEIASLAGCLMREEMLDNDGTVGDEASILRRREGLTVAMERVRGAFFGTGYAHPPSTQKVISGLTAYKGVQEALFGQGLVSNHMNIPLPRNIYTTTTTTAASEKLSDARKTRLTVDGEVLSKQVLSSSNTDAKRVQLKALNKPLFPPGVGFDIPAPFRELKLAVKIDGEERLGTFDELVSTYCSKRSNKDVKQFTKGVDFSFLTLQKMIKNHSSLVVWDEQVASIGRLCTYIFQRDQAVNYKAIVAGLCIALNNVEPGEAIAGSEMIKPAVAVE